jgi:hypothetical protein
VEPRPPESAPILGEPLKILPRYCFAQARLKLCTPPTQRREPRIVLTFVFSPIPAVVAMVEADLSPFRAASHPVRFVNKM